VAVMEGTGVGSVTVELGTGRMDWWYSWV